jgi:uncharacterized protein
MKIRKRKWLGLWIVFSLIFTLFACSSNDESNQENESKPTETAITDDENAEKEAEDEQIVYGSEDGSGGFLWKAEDNGNSVYMLGSIHVATEDFYPLHMEIEKAYQASSVLAVEADIYNVSLIETQKLISEKAMYPGETTLKDSIPNEVYEKLKKALNKHHIPLIAVEKYKPWYVYMLLDSLKTLESGFDPDLGIDYHFLSRATDEDFKEIVELESMEFQLDVLNNFSPEVQLYLLETVLEDDSTYEEDMKKLANLWKDGDAEGLEQLLFTQQEELREEEQIFNKEMLDNRNVGMANKIEQFLQNGEEETYFVIVGAAHYFGEKGIVKLLEEKGYAVEKVL